MDAGRDAPLTTSIPYVVSEEPTAVGVPLNLLATANGGTLEYQFLWNDSATNKASATWTKLTYGVGRGYAQTPTTPGFYTFRVYARERGSNVATYQIASADVKVEVKAAITATNVVGGAQPQWKFWAKRRGTSAWVLLQDYGTSATCTTWRPDTAGTYDVMVYVREVGSKATAYDLSRTAVYVVQ